MAVTEINKRDLRLDMKKGPNDDWNAAVIHILVKRMEKAHSRAQLPQRPREYFKDIVRGRFDRARIQWRKGQRKVTETGILETTEEVSNRVAEGKDHELAAARDRERKASVRVSFVIDASVFLHRAEILS
jgi:hypothetical protein